MKFESVNATSSLSPKVITRVLGIALPYELPNNQKDGCQQLQSTNCPLDPKEFAIYTLSMPILKSYPSISIEIELNMIGDDSKSQFCFKVDCKVE